MEYVKLSSKHSDERFANTLAPLKGNWLLKTLVSLNEKVSPSNICLFKDNFDPTKCRLSANQISCNWNYDLSSTFLSAKFFSKQYQTVLIRAISQKRGKNLQREPMAKISPSSSHLKPSYLTHRTK